MDVVVFFYLFILGISVGSFLNVVIDRLPKKKSLLGRSRCDHCKKQLRPAVLIPVFSYLMTGGKSVCCKKPINSRYPLVEALTGVMFVLVWVLFPSASLGVKIVHLAIFASLIALFFIDLYYQIIPDELQVVLLVLALVLFIAQNGGESFWVRVLDGVITTLPILLIYLVTKGKGMGFGDVKYSFIVGLLLGSKLGLFALYLAFVAGAVVGVPLLVSGKKKLKSKIAFGPFLVVGTVVALVFQNEILALLRYLYGI